MSDLTERLRAVARFGGHVTDSDAELAADELDRLRRELTEMRERRAEWIRDTCRLNAMIEQRDRELAEARADNERLQKAHDHQREMAGLMLREAERYGHELDEARELLREAEGDLYSSPDLRSRIDAFLTPSPPTPNTRVT